MSHTYMGCGHPGESVVMALVCMLVAGCSSVAWFINREGDVVSFGFWLTDIIWMLFRAVIALADFHYDLFTYQICFVVLDTLLGLITSCFCALAICRLYFAISAPGRPRLVFFEVGLAACVAVFLAIIVVVVSANRDDDAELARADGAWRGATAILCAGLVWLPARGLGANVVERSGVRTTMGFLAWSARGVGCILIVQGVWGVLEAFALNAFENYVYEHRANPSAGSRAGLFFRDLVFVVARSLLMLGVVHSSARLERAVSGARQLERRAAATESGAGLDWPLVHMK